MVKALLNAEVGKEFSEDAKQHGLYAATGARCLECIDELLQRGAQPDRGMRFISDNSQAIPAVDIAAKRYWIAGLRRLDQKGKYKEFISSFEKEFPTLRTSPFIGAWDNHRDGFSASQIYFDADATGVLSGYRVPFVWRTSEQGVIIFLVTEKGIDREKTVQLTYDLHRGELLWAREKAETEHYRKVSKSP